MSGVRNAPVMTGSTRRFVLTAFQVGVVSWWVVSPWGCLERGAGRLRTTSAGNHASKHGRATYPLSSRHRQPHLASKLHTALPTYPTNKKPFKRCFGVFAHPQQY